MTTIDIAEPKLLPVVELKLRSRVVSLVAETDDVIQYWIALAESLLESFNLDSTLPGYETNIRFAVRKYTEYLYLEDDESTIVNANSPFKSERIGSYSYTRADPAQTQETDEGFFAGLPAIVAAIIKRYLSGSSPVSFTTSVFRQTKPNEEGVREYHDYLDEMVVERPDLFNAIRVL